MVEREEKQQDSKDRARALKRNLQNIKLDIHAGH